MGSRRLAGLVFLLFLLALGCASLVEQDLSRVRCTETGVVGPPACDDGQLCVAGRCEECAERDECGDRLDNDCNGRVDDACIPPTSGGFPGWYSEPVAGASGQGSGDSRRAFM